MSLQDAHTTIGAGSMGVTKGGLTGAVRMDKMSERRERERERPGALIQRYLMDN